MTQMHDDAEHATKTQAIEHTGHQRIDEALGRLQRLDDLEITDHPEQFDAIHGVLRASLANAGRDDVALDTP